MTSPKDPKQCTDVYHRCPHLYENECSTKCYILTPPISSSRLGDEKPAHRKMIACTCPIPEDHYEEPQPISELEEQFADVLEEVPEPDAPLDSEEELEQATQEWIDKNVDPTLGFVNWTTGHKSLTTFVHRREQEAVIKALKHLNDIATEFHFTGKEYEHAVDDAIEQHRTKQ